jgi:hypothetical protein
MHGSMNVKLLSSIVSQLQLWHLNLTVSVPSVGASAVGVMNPCVTKALLPSSKLVVWMTSTGLKQCEFPCMLQDSCVYFMIIRSQLSASVQCVYCVNLTTRRIIAISAAEKYFNPSHGYACLENQTSYATASTCF